MGAGAEVDGRVLRDVGEVELDGVDLAAQAQVAMRIKSFWVRVQVAVVVQLVVGKRTLGVGWDPQAVWECERADC